MDRITNPVSLAAQLLNLPDIRCTPLPCSDSPLRFPATADAKPGRQSPKCGQVIRGTFRGAISGNRPGIHRLSEIQQKVVANPDYRRPAFGGCVDPVDHQWSGPLSLYLLVNRPVHVLVKRQLSINGRRSFSVKSGSHPINIRLPGTAPQFRIDVSNPTR